MLPAFDIEGGLGLGLMRGLSVAALLSVFGALLFRTAVAGAVLQNRDADVFQRSWRRLFWASWSAAMATTIGWLVLEAASIANARTLLAAAVATSGVLADTRFGHVLLLRLAVLTAVALMQGSGTRRLSTATILAAVATALQAGHSHAAAMEDGLGILLLSEVVHLLAAGAWLGGLLPLLLLTASASPHAAAIAARRFSPLGIACVVLLASTASFQFWVLIGGLPGAIGTGYGLLALVKLVLFGLLLGLASRNRFRWTPALEASAPAAARRALCSNIAIEAGLGLLVVLAAGLLTSLPPAMHVQPLWPFPYRPSLDTIREDADIRLEVIEAVLALGGAAALLVLACLLPHLRWAGIALAVAIGGFALPHLDPLLVAAYPTSYWLSPTGFAASSIVDGARLFPDHCASCHGAGGRGDGPASKGLVPAADLTADHLWMHSDGELFWWLSHGIDMPGGGTAMPGFAGVLSDDQRWNLIDYIRAHNAGTIFGHAGGWSPPLKAPELQARCGDRTVTLLDLRGRFVRLVIGGSAVPAMTSADVVTLVVPPDTTPTGPGTCVIDDEVVPSAYSVVAGIPAADLQGTQFLIDDHGWLRALQRAGVSGSWNNLNNLAAEIRDLRARPIAAPSGSGDHMNMRMQE